VISVVQRRAAGEQIADRDAETVKAELPPE